MDEDVTDSVRRLNWSVFFRLDEDAEFLLLSDLNMVARVRVPDGSRRFRKQWDASPQEAVRVAGKQLKT